MGRHPKPLNGNAYGNTKKWGKPSTCVTGGIPEPPHDISLEARAVWEHVTELLAPSGCLALCDDIQLGVFADDVVEYRRIQRMIADETEVEAMAKLYSIKGKLDVSIRAHMKNLGLTPLARAQLRIGVTDNEHSGGDDDAEPDFFGRGDGDGGG